MIVLGCGPQYGSKKAPRDPQYQILKDTCINFGANFRIFLEMQKNQQYHDTTGLRPPGCFKKGTSGLSLLKSEGHMYQFGGQCPHIFCMEMQKKSAVS